MSLLLAAFLFTTSYSAGVIEQDNKAYLSNTVIVKLKNNVQAGAGKIVSPNAVLLGAMQPYGLMSVKKFLPFETKSESTLNNIIVVEYTSNVDPQIVAGKLKDMAEVEWAEPKYLRQVEHIPNDPQINTQYALDKISAYQAWDISKGDSAIIIAIIDTGVDWDHPDLAGNIWTNKDEIAENGVDDDNNGYIDDTRGWDFGGLSGTPDNNPMEDNPYHGTHVAGIASGVTDNGAGIASIGFNCSIMPVKVAQDNLKNSSGQPFIVYGDEGIIYAVDNGARIINCSFGGGGFSILDQEIIDYAVNHNVLVVAAAGNENSSSNFYPASYRGALSVASTGKTDARSSYSNYGTLVDVTAPGDLIRSTWQGDLLYREISGTSMASPLAAGLAGLVAARFPAYSPDQIAEQIRINADDIRTANPALWYLLGKGRINAFKALNNTNSISARAVKFDFSDAAPGGNGNGIIESGETISIGVRFVNYLSPTTNLTVNLQSMNGGVSVLDGLLTAGTVATLDSFDNYNSRFTVSLSNNVPQNSDLIFLLNYSDGSYTDYQPFNVIANPVYATQKGNDVTLTISSNGKLAFNDFPSNLQGSGFHYLDGKNLLFEGALVLGTSAAKLSDGARNANASGQNNDFTVVEPIKLFPGLETGQQGRTVFNDDNAGNNKLGVTITLTSFSYTDPPNNNYIILNYNIANNSGAALTGLYAGLFFDWDMVEGSGLNDITGFDTQGKLGYVYHRGGNPDNYIGTALISHDSYGFRALVNPGTGLSDQLKWEAISGGIPVSQVGPDDIFHFISGGPYDIGSGENTDVAFAIGAAANIEDLRVTIANARSKYTSVTGIENNEDIPLSYALEQNYPNPFNPTTNFEFRIASASGGGHVEFKVYDIMGREVAVLVNEEKPAGIYNISFDASNLASGVYFYRLTAGGFKATKKMIVLK